FRCCRRSTGAGSLAGERCERRGCPRRGKPRTDLPGRAFPHSRSVDKRRPQPFFLILREVTRDDFELPCRLEGFYDPIGCHLPDHEEECRSCFRYFAAHLFDEFLADPIIGEVGAECSHRCAQGGAEEGNEEDESEKHSPKRAVTGRGTREVA